MSKAFTRESDDAGIEAGPAPLEIPIPPGAKNYLTPAGARRMQEELERLRALEMPELSRAVVSAPRDPSTAEVAGLNALKGRLREVERRIDFLTRRLNLAEVIDPSQQRPDRVQFGATVTVQDETGRKRRYRIVGIDEAEAARGDISWISPLARALMGARPGDAVPFRSPRREEELEVLRVEYLEE